MTDQQHFQQNILSSFVDNGPPINFLKSAIDNALYKNLGETSFDYFSEIIGTRVEWESLKQQMEVDTTTIYACVEKLYRLAQTKQDASQIASVISYIETQYHDIQNENSSFSQFLNDLIQTQATQTLEDHVVFTTKAEAEKYIDDKLKEIEASIYSYFETTFIEVTDADEYVNNKLAPEAVLDALAGEGNVTTDDLSNYLTQDQISFYVTKSKLGDLNTLLNPTTDSLSHIVLSNQFVYDLSRLVTQLNDQGDYIVTAHLATPRTTAAMNTEDPFVTATISGVPAQTWLHNYDDVRYNGEFQIFNITETTFQYKLNGASPELALTVGSNFSTEPYYFSYLRSDGYNLLLSFKGLPTTFVEVLNKLSEMFDTTTGLLEEAIQENNEATQEHELSTNELSTNVTLLNNSINELDANFETLNQTYTQLHDHYDISGVKSISTDTRSTLIQTQIELSELQKLQKATEDQINAMQAQAVHVNNKITKTFTPAAIYLINLATNREMILAISSTDRSLYSSWNTFGSYGISTISEFSSTFGNYFTVVATIKEANHDLIEGGNIIVEGAEVEEYNGIFEVLEIDGSSIKYYLRNKLDIGTDALSGRVEGVTVKRAVKDIDILNDVYSDSTTDKYNWTPKNVIGGPQFYNNEEGLKVTEITYYEELEIHKFQVIKMRQDSDHIYLSVVVPNNTLRPAPGYPILNSDDVFILELDDINSHFDNEFFSDYVINNEHIILSATLEEYERHLDDPFPVHVQVIKFPIGINGIPEIKTSEELTEKILTWQRMLDWQATYESWLDDLQKTHFDVQNAVLAQNAPHLYPQNSELVTKWNDFETFYGPRPIIESTPPESFMRIYFPKGRNSIYRDAYESWKTTLDPTSPNDEETFTNSYYNPLGQSVKESYILRTYVDPRNIGTYDDHNNIDGVSSFPSEIDIITSLYDEDMITLCTPVLSTNYFVLININGSRAKEDDPRYDPNKTESQQEYIELYAEYRIENGQNIFSQSFYRYEQDEDTKIWSKKFERNTTNVDFNHNGATAMLLGKHGEGGWPSYMRANHPTYTCVAKGGTKFSSDLGEETLSKYLILNNLLPAIRDLRLYLKFTPPPASSSRSTLSKKNSIVSFKIQNGELTLNIDIFFTPNLNPADAGVELRASNRRYREAIFGQALGDVDVTRQVSTIKVAATYTVTATTSSGHGIRDTSIVTISGVTGDDADIYNGSFRVSNVTDTTFDYTLTSAPENNNLSNESFTAVTYSSTGLRLQSSVTSLTHAPTYTATATIPSGHGLVNRSIVEISGVTGVDADIYNRTFEVTNVTETTFDFTLTSAPESGYVPPFITGATVAFPTSQIPLGMFTNTHRYYSMVSHGQNPVFDTLLVGGAYDTWVNSQAAGADTSEAAYTSSTGLAKPAIEHGLVIAEFVKENTVIDQIQWYIKTGTAELDEHNFLKNITSLSVGLTSYNGLVPQRYYRLSNLELFSGNQIKGISTDFDTYRHDYPNTGIEEEKVVDFVKGDASVIFRCITENNESMSPMAFLGAVFVIENTEN
mgnify:CR=1 FL=1